MNVPRKTWENQLICKITKSDKYSTLDHSSSTIQPLISDTGGSELAWCCQMLIITNDNNIQCLQQQKEIALVSYTSKEKKRTQLPDQHWG